MTKSIFILIIASILFAGPVLAQDHNLGPYEPVQVAMVQKHEPVRVEASKNILDKKFTDMTVGEAIEKGYLPSDPIWKPPTWKTYAKNFIVGLIQAVILVAALGGA